MEDWLTVDQAAELADYHPERIRELLREEKIAGRKFSTVWMVDRSSLLAYVEQINSKGKKRGPKP